MSFMRVGAGQVRTYPKLLLPSALQFYLVGTKYSGIRFRRALLDTIPHIGKSNMKQQVTEYPSFVFQISWHMLLYPFILA